MSGSEGPNIAMVGAPDAAARWVIPLSFPMQSDARESKAARVSRSSPGSTWISGGESISCASAGPNAQNTLNPCVLSIRDTLTNDSTLPFFLGLPLPG